MRKKSKQFKIDLGFGNMFPSEKVMPRQNTNPLPTYTGEKYAILTSRDGTVVKHTFNNPTRAQAFREKAKASGSYSVVSDIQFDW